MPKRALPIDAEIQERVDTLDLTFGPLGLDPYGVDRIELARFMTTAGWFYRYYFKAQVFGIEHVPDRGRAMLIGNHSGGVALDAGMVMCSMFFSHNPPRLAQAMIEKFIHKFPGASQIMSRIGQFTGNPDQARRLLEDEHLLLVFPEGAQGTAKLAKHADTLVQFGTGFMRLALATKSPIVPFAFVGGGEAIPTIANLKRIGKMLGVPYIPITPYILPLPKPTSFQLIYGTPMHFEGSGDEADSVIQEMVVEVRQRITKLIEQGEAFEIRSSTLKNWCLNESAFDRGFGKARPNHCQAFARRKVRSARHRSTCMARRT